MILPYATDQQTHRRPYAILVLIGLQAILLPLVCMVSGITKMPVSRLFMYIGIVPANFHLYSLLTYMFLQAGFIHLLLNMFFLWVFGAGVEDAIGSLRTILLFIICGITGGLLQDAITIRLLDSRIAMEPILGSSAACAGLIGLYAVRYYRARISFTLIPVKPHVVTVVSLFLLYEMSSGLWAILTGRQQDGVAHWAHVGGFVCGLVIAHLMGLSRLGQSAYMKQDAESAMESTRPGAAMKRWAHVLQHDPSNLEARKQLALCWFMLGDTDQASTLLGQNVSSCMEAGNRLEAARCLCELLSRHLPLPKLSTEWKYMLGCALEEIEESSYAAEFLKEMVLNAEVSIEAENGILKAASIYVYKLDQPEAALSLLDLFDKRFPKSTWSIHAAELRKACQNKSQQ